jgi:hypothetical protein
VAKELAIADDMNANRQIINQISGSRRVRQFVGDTTSTPRGSKSTVIRKRRWLCGEKTRSPTPRWGSHVQQRHGLTMYNTGDALAVGHNNSVPTDPDSRA